MSAEQQARDLLERMEVPGAQDFTAGELVELANLIADRSARLLVACHCHCHDAMGVGQ